MGRDEPEVDHQAFAMAFPVQVNDSPNSEARSYGVSAPASSIMTIPAGNTASTVPMWQQEKQGAKCCGCCCDYRRAVIAVAIISICIGIGTAMLLIAAASMPAYTTSNIDDDQVLEILDDGLSYQAILSAIFLFTAICALVGALKFNIWLVFVNLVWYIGSFILGTIDRLAAADKVNATMEAGKEYTPVPDIVFGLVITALFMYPHIGFIIEVRRGIMTRETYSREEHSCCCVSTFA